MALCDHEADHRAVSLAGVTGHRLLWCLLFYDGTQADPLGPLQLSDRHITRVDRLGSIMREYSRLSTNTPLRHLLLATMILLGYLLLGGFQLNLSAIHDGFVWIADHSFARHAFESTLTTELEDQLVAVDVPGAPKIRIKSEVIMEALGLDPTEEQNAHNILSLIVLGVASAAAHSSSTATLHSTHTPSLHPPSVL